MSHSKDSISVDKSIKEKRETRVASNRIIEPGIARGGVKGEARTISGELEKIPRGGTGFLMAGAVLRGSRGAGPAMPSASRGRRRTSARVAIGHIFFVSAKALRSPSRVSGKLPG